MSAIRSDIPARLDRLPWSGWHWRVVIALGVSWLLDGLEVTVVGSLGPALQRPDTLGLTASQIGWAASAYIGGAVLGALFFGRLADRLGRKRMFLVTLVVYLHRHRAHRVLLGHLVLRVLPLPHRLRHRRRVRGDQLGDRRADSGARCAARVDLAINGTFWIGAALGAGLSVVLLDPDFIGPEWGWRIAFGLGGVLALRHPAGAPPRAREPALAADARPRRGSRSGRAGHRAGGRRHRHRCDKRLAMRALRIDALERSLPRARRCATAAARCSASP